MQQHRKLSQPLFFISVSQLTGQHRWCILPLRHTHNTPTPVSTYQSGASAHFVRTIHNTWHVEGKNRRSLRMSRTSQKRQRLLTNITGSRGASGLFPVKAAPDNDCKSDREAFERRNDTFFLLKMERLRSETHLHSVQYTKGNYS